MEPSLAKTAKGESGPEASSQKLTTERIRASGLPVEFSTWGHLWNGPPWR